MMGARQWEAKGIVDAMLGEPFTAVATAMAEQRRPWLAGWLDHAVTGWANGIRDLPMFHAKPTRGAWSDCALDLLRIGCELRAPKTMIAALLGRSHSAVRSKAKKCGFTRRAP
jgi:hypothetical protein